MYELVVVLGLKLNENWQITDDMRIRLDYASDLYFKGLTTNILVSGRWSIWNDWLKIKPPITETRAMKNYLSELGVPKASILIENYSKDTIGNIFGLKYFYPKPYKTIAIICAVQHIDRVKFLSQEILPSIEGITFLPVSAPNFDKDTTGKEEIMVVEQGEVVKELLAKRKKNPNYRIYSHPYYTKQAKMIQKI